MPLAVELEGVSFGYRPGQRVLEDVDLELGEGEFVARRGPERRRQDDARPDRPRARAARRRDGAPLRRAGASLLAPARARLPRAALRARRRRAGDGTRGRLGGTPRRGWARRAAAQPRSRARRRGDRARRARRRAPTRRCARSRAGCSSARSSRRRSPGEPSLLVLDEPTTGVDAESQESLAALLDRLHCGARRDDPLRLPRVRRGRALRRSGSCSCGGRSSSTGRRTSLPGVWHDPSHVHARE